MLAMEVSVLPQAAYSVEHVLLEFHTTLCSSQVELALLAVQPALLELNRARLVFLLQIECVDTYALWAYPGTMVPTTRLSSGFMLSIDRLLSDVPTLPNVHEWSKCCLYSVL